MFCQFVKLNSFQGGISRNTVCNIRLVFVYHEYESHFRIEARFNRRDEDINDIREEYHQVYLNLTYQSFEKNRFPNDIDCAQVEDLAQLPELLQKDEKVKNAHGSDMLYVITFDYQKIWPISLMNEFEGRTPEANAALQRLRKIDTRNSQLKLYFRGGLRDLGEVKKLKRYLAEFPNNLDKYRHNTGSVM